MDNFIINAGITDTQILLIDDENNNLGAISTRDAINMAADKGLDVVIVDQSSRPPTAKMMLYEKFLYQKRKREKDIKRNKRDTRIKSFTMNANIGEHDINSNVRKILKLLNNKKIIKISVQLRGREAHNSDLAHHVMNRVMERLQEESNYKVMAPLKFENATLSITIC